MCCASRANPPWRHPHPPTRRCWLPAASQVWVSALDAKRFLVAACRPTEIGRKRSDRLGTIKVEKQTFINHTPGQLGDNRRQGRPARSALIRRVTEVATPRSCLTIYLSQLPGFGRHSRPHDRQTAQIWLGFCARAMLPSHPRAIDLGSRLGPLADLTETKNGRRVF
jgi:hypothetical protein